MSATRVDLPRWVKPHPAAQQPYSGTTKAALVFPHAGGAALAYRGLGSALAAAGTDAYVLQYPRRGDRLGHPAPATVGDLARDLFEAGDWAHLGPLRLFGHCMGAVVAFEFARVAERRGADVVALWASASEAPSTVAARPRLPMARDDVLAEMVDLGGTDPRLLDDDDFVDLLLTAVRADYAAFNRYACDSDVTIAADVHVLGGTDDHRVDADGLRRWERHTRGAFTLSTFDGGHFFVDDHAADVAELIRDL